MKPDFLLKLAFDFYKYSSDEDVPHRVIYHYAGKYSSRVFANKAKADEFAATCKNLILVQPASEPPPENPRHKFVNMKKQIQYNDCACGKKKMTAEEMCKYCAGFDLP